MDIIEEPPVAGTEAETLVGALERNRRTFAWKTGGLDRAALSRTLGVSTMTLGGLVNHLALVEADYFARRLLGEDLGTPWDAVNWDEDPDWEWRTAAGETPETLYRRWEEAVARSRVNLRRIVEKGDLGQGEPSVRRILVDMVEEYARHTGHADLIRESIDGLVGEDAPR